jgi:hypothetical protein
VLPHRPAVIMMTAYGNVEKNQRGQVLGFNI